jgi:hypothetical protein
VAGVRGGEIGTLHQPEAGKASKLKGGMYPVEVRDVEPVAEWSLSHASCERSQKTGRRDSRLVAP